MASDYDFDALYDDEKSSKRQKKIMDLFMDENASKEMFSFEIKEKAGFGKGGEKNFEGANKFSTKNCFTYESDLFDCWR